MPTKKVSWQNFKAKILVIIQIFGLQCQGQILTLSLSCLSSLSWKLEDWKAFTENTLSRSIYMFSLLKSFPIVQGKFFFSKFYSELLIDIIIRERFIIIIYHSSKGNFWTFPKTSSQIFVAEKNIIFTVIKIYLIIPIIFTCSFAYILAYYFEWHVRFWYDCGVEV